MEKPIKNILIPVNFSSSASNSTRVAVAMCRRHNASLHLLRVNDGNGLRYPTGKKALTIGMRLESIAAERKSMESLAQRISEIHHIPCFFHVKEGDFTKTVSEVAEDFYCDLIVVEKRSPTFPFGMSFNRDVHSIIQTSPCPVMSIPGNGCHDQFKSILFPVWIRRSVLSKLRVVLPIIEKNASKVVVFGSLKSPGNIWERQMINSLTSTARALISLSTKNVEKEVQEGPGTARSILKKAEERKSELIVISAGAEGKFLSLFKPAYERFIINNSTVPVLAIK